MSEAASLETRQNPWWLLLLGGILNVIVGIMLLTIPGKTVLAMIWVLGLYWVISGIFTIVGMFVDHSAWGWKLLMGILSILAGIVVLRHPIVSAVAIPRILILLLGIQGIIVGIIGVVMAFKGGGWGAAILGVLSVIFGIILVMNWANFGAALVLYWVVAIFALVGGVIQIIRAFMQRKD